MWTVCVWKSPTKGYSRDFPTKEEAYLWANAQNVFAVEVYGPDDYHDSWES